MPPMIKKRHLHRRKVPERCFIVYSKSRFSDQARSVYFCAFCAFLCFFAPVENSVDNHFSLWITLYHIVLNTTSLLVYSVRCPSVNPGAVLSGRGAVRARCCQGATGGGILKKSARSTPQKNIFSAFFLKKFFRAYILFPLLYQKKREKIAPKNFLKKGVDMGRPKVYYRDTPRGTPQRHPLCGVRYPVREVERLTVLHRSR